MISLSAQTTKARIKVWQSSVQDEIWNELKLTQTQIISSMKQNTESESLRCIFTILITAKDQIWLHAVTCISRYDLRLPTEEMHLLAPHGEGRCTAAAAKADLNVAYRYGPRHKRPSPRQIATSLRDSHLQFEFLKKRGTHCQCSGLPGFPCLDDSRIFCQCFLQRTKQSSRSSRNLQMPTNISGRLRKLQ